VVWRRWERDVRWDVSDISALLWMVVVWVICIGVGSVVLITKVEAKQGEMPKTKQGTKIPS